MQASGTSPVDLSRLCSSAFRLSRAHDLGSGSTDNVSNQPAGIVEMVEDIDPRTWYLHAGGRSKSGLGRCRTAEGIQLLRIPTAKTLALPAQRLSRRCIFHRAAVGGPHLRSPFGCELLVVGPFKSCFMLADQTGSLELFATDVVLSRIDRLWGDTSFPVNARLFPSCSVPKFRGRSEILHFVRIWGRSN